MQRPTNNRLIRTIATKKARIKGMEIRYNIGNILCTSLGTCLFGYVSYNLDKEFEHDSALPIALFTFSIASPILSYLGTNSKIFDAKKALYNEEVLLNIFQYQNNDGEGGDKTILVKNDLIIEEVFKQKCIQNHTTPDEVLYAIQTLEYEDYSDSVKNALNDFVKSIIHQSSFDTSCLGKAISPSNDAKEYTINELYSQMFGRRYDGPNVLQRSPVTLEMKNLKVQNLEDITIEGNKYINNTSNFRGVDPEEKKEPESEEGRTLLGKEDSQTRKLSL